MPSNKYARIDNINQLKDIYGKDGAVMVDLIKKSTMDFNDKFCELVEMWDDMFDHKPFGIEATAIGMLCALVLQIKQLEKAREDEDIDSDAINGLLRMLKRTIVEMADKIDVKDR